MNTIEDLKKEIEEIKKRLQKIEDKCDVCGNSEKITIECPDCSGEGTRKEWVHRDSGGGWEKSKCKKCDGKGKITRCKTCWERNRRDELAPPKKEPTVSAWIDGVYVGGHDFDD